MKLRTGSRGGFKAESREIAFSGGSEIRIPPPPPDLDPDPDHNPGPIARGSKITITRTSKPLRNIDVASQDRSIEHERKVGYLIWEHHPATGLLVERRDPGYAVDSSRRERYTYTPAHQLHVITRARGVSVTHQYAPATGELTGKSYSDGTPPVTFTYLRSGALHQVGDVTGTRTFNYRTLDLRLDHVTLPAFYGGHRLTRTYDTYRRAPNGLDYGPSTDSDRFYRSVQTYQGGRVSEVRAFQRNSSSRLTISYSFAGQSDLVEAYSVNVGSGFRVERGWRDHENLVESIENRYGAGGVRARSDHSFDAVGRIATASASGELYTGFGSQSTLHTTYTYDTMGRLQQAIGRANNSGGTVMKSRSFFYGMDVSGNRTYSSVADRMAAYKRNYTPTATGGYSQIVDGSYDVLSGSTPYVPLVWDEEEARWLPTSGAQLPKPGGGTVFEHVFNTTSGNNTASAYDRWFWFSEPYLQWQQWTYPKKTQTPVYDKDGNLTHDSQFSYVYDAENRLSEVASGADRIRMKYDYRNRRVETIYEKNLGGTWAQQWIRRYLYDGFNVIAEIDPTQLASSDAYVRRAFHWGYDISGSFGGAGGIGALLVIDDWSDGASKRFLPAYDSRGSIVGLIAAAAMYLPDPAPGATGNLLYATGSLVAQFEYDPYGSIIRQQGATDRTPFRYQTKWDMDSGTEGTAFYSWGLVDYGLRYYQPKHGRFLNRDPIGEAGGLNLYEAFGGDPVNRWDFLGLDDLPTFNLVNFEAGALPGGASFITITGDRIYVYRYADGSKFHSEVPPLNGVFDALSLEGCQQWSGCSGCSAADFRVFGNIPSFHATKVQEGKARMVADFR